MRSEPLPIGERCPEVVAAHAGPLLLRFAAGDWDPAAPETLAIYRRVLASHLGGGTEVTAIERRARRCDVRLASDETVAIALVEADAIDPGLAGEFGVVGKEALFVIDDGRVRWRYVGEPGASPSIMLLMRSLAAIRPPSASSASPQRLALSRRQFAAAGLAVAVLASAGAGTAVAQARTTLDGRGPVERPVGPGDVDVRLVVNGSSHDLRLDPRTTLLDALRNHLGLTGSKKGCDHGQCGACTVLVDGRRINSCLTLALTAAGKSVTTIEGLARGDRLHPMQAAFLEHDGLQCGYCTPGQIMSAVGLLQEPCGEDEAAIRECMSGNICRCGAYQNIVAAIRDARSKGAQHATF